MIDSFAQCSEQQFQHLSRRDVMVRHAARAAKGGGPAGVARLRLSSINLAPLAMRRIISFTLFSVPARHTAHAPSTASLVPPISVAQLLTSTLFAVRHASCPRSRSGTTWRPPSRSLVASSCGSQRVAVRCRWRVARRAGRPHVPRVHRAPVDSKAQDPQGRPGGRRLGCESVRPCQATRARAPIRWQHRQCQAIFIVRFERDRHSLRRPVRTPHAGVRRLGRL
jgi:hypothetical protein